jgi:YD repeat-containing protein
MTASLTYGYDATDQLTSATAADFGGINESYDYDALGNRTVSQLSASYVTGPSNRLLEDDSFCYAYDLNGSLTTKTAKVAGAYTGGVTTFTWDAENRLTRIAFPGGGFAAYLYDGFGRRIEKNADGAVTRYVYDREDIYLEYDGGNTLLARYTHGPGADEPLAIERDLDANGTFEATEVFMYHQDSLGRSPRSPTAQAPSPSRG